MDEKEQAAYERAEACKSFEELDPFIVKQYLDLKKAQYDKWLLANPCATVGPPSCLATPGEVVMWAHRNGYDYEA